jgi:hypothetical protein
MSPHKHIAPVPDRLLLLLLSLIGENVDDEMKSKHHYYLQPEATPPWPVTASGIATCV